MSAERFFDDLARTLAEPMPRRRALRMALGAAVGAAVPGVSASRALSAPTRTAACPKDTAEIKYSPCECPSTIPGLFAKTCCPTTRYDKWDCTCPGGDMPKAVCVHRSTCPEERRHCGPCCPPDQVCNTLVEKCECKKRCGGECCKPGEICKNNRCEKSKICGPDITDALNDALSRVESAFTEWSLYRRNTACGVLVAPPWAIFSWDITQLGPAGREKFAKSSQPDCGTCEAYGSRAGYSAQLGGSCHFVGSVNYVVYGKMMRLCHDHLRGSIFSFAARWYSADEMATYIAIHKTSLRTGKEASNLDASIAWARAGYNGWPETTRTPPGDAEGCGKCPEKYAGPGFTVQWFPWLIRPN